MLHITRVEDGIELYKALGSEIRVDILKTLLDNGSMYMNELASHLNITSGALTSHIKKLEETGIVKVSSESTGHGNRKICSVQLDSIMIDLKDSGDNQKNVAKSSIRIGHYTAYDVAPTCGLSTSASIIGQVDDTRYFSHPDRYDADILWFTKGFVEYDIPNLIPVSQQIDQISLSFEIGSEAPGCNEEWPSDIHFSLNGIPLGFWTSPGDFGDVRGLLTPDWWYPNWNQYGLLKMLVINHRGTFIDGLRICDTRIDDFRLTARSPLHFRFYVPEDAKHVGGLTLFGRTFGNYNQDIEARISYSPISS